MYEQYFHTQHNNSTSGYYATHVLQGYLSRNTAHTVSPKLKAWPWNKTCQPSKNTVSHKKVSRRPLIIFHPKAWKKLNNQPNGGWFSQERRPKIKILFQGLKHTAQPKDRMPISMQMLSYLSSSIMQGFPDVNSVEPPLAPQKQSRTITFQMWLMITTNWQFSWKHNAVKYL